MTRIPVLLLISKNIDLHILNHSPRLEEYHFFSVTAIDYLGTDSSNRRVQRLLSTLNQSIKRIEPRFLLAHLGLAFDRYPVDFLTAVLDTHILHPQLKIGLDKSLMYAFQYLRTSAAPRPKINSLVARLSRHRSAFDIDEETAALVACLY